MQTLSSANEIDCLSSSGRLNSLAFNSSQSVKAVTNRRTTLGMVQLRSVDKRVCINWSIVSSSASNKVLKELTESLEQKINESMEQPLEILEDKLFYLCYIFYVDLNGIVPKSQIIEVFHLVNVIQEQSVKTPQMSKALLELSKVSEDYMKNYEFLCNFIKLINDLSLIYGIINLFNYRHRFDQSIENLKILNLPSLFSDIINMEVIWLSYAVTKPPLAHIFNSEVKKTAKLLQDEFYKTLHVFMESNRNNLQSKESIQTWLASKNLKLVEDYGFHGKPSGKKPSYQSLTQKMFSCFSCKAGFQAVELKNQLFEFEKIYSHFEAVVLKSFCELQKCNN